MNHGSGDTDTENALKAILPDLKKGNMSPCYLLYGEEGFLIRDALNRIINLILPGADRDLNLFYMDGDQEDVESLCQSLLTPPLIAGRKVVVLTDTRLFHSTGISPELIQKIRHHMGDNPDRAAQDFMHFLRLTGWSLDDLRDGGWKKIRNQDWQKTVGKDGGQDREKWLPGVIELCLARGLKEGRALESGERLAHVLKSGLPEGNHLILTAGAVDKRKKIFKIISETGRILHFPQIKYENRKKQALMDIAKKRLDEAGKTMTPGAWVVLGKKTGFDAATSVEAIEKLMTYTGNQGRIEEKDVEDVVGKTREGTIFDLTNALSEKNLIAALTALKDLFDQGVHELLILSMIIREIRLLLHACVLMESGKLEIFDSKMDYSRFQRSVYPVIRSWTDGTGGKEGGGALIRQNPYVIYHALKHSQRFSPDSLVEYLEALVNMDMAFKSTAGNPRFLLERFIMRVCS